MTTCLQSSRCDVSLPSSGKWCGHSTQSMFGDFASMKIPFCLRDNWIAVLFSNFSFGHDPTGENVVKVGAGFGWHGDAHAAAFSEPSGGGIVCCALAGGTSVIVGANDNICHLRRQDQIFDPTSRERGPNRHCARYGN